MESVFHLDFGPYEIIYLPFGVAAGVRHAADRQASAFADVRDLLDSAVVAMEVGWPRPIFERSVQTADQNGLDR